MSINYSVTMMKTPNDPEGTKKAYARAQMKEELSLKALSQRVANETTVSRADIMAVLIATSENIVEALEEGYQVDFGELGRFRVELVSTGAMDAESFTSDHITGAKVKFVAGHELRNLFPKLQFNPVASRMAQRAVLRAEKKGETNVDLSRKKADTDTETAD